MKAILLVFSFFLMGQVNTFSQNIFSSSPIPAILDQKIDIDNYTIRRNNEAGFRQSEINTIGSRLLLKKWVNGSVVTMSDTVYNGPALLFNYDKLQGDLLVQKSDNTIFAVDKNKIKSFILREAISNDTIKEYNFEKIEIVNKNSFCQVLVKGQKYSLYKLPKTKFVKSNYSTNGIVESGSKYDSYEDEFEFYIVSKEKNEVKKVDLKKKAIKQALHFEEVKVEVFFKAHSFDAIDENFLTGLIAGLNQ